MFEAIMRTVRCIICRETKSVLRELKVIGDRAAYNRRHNAVRADLEMIHCL